MSNHDDLQSVIDQLRAHRPEASALELDTIKQRVRARASHPARRRTRRAQLMKSRLVILTMLVFGMLLSTAGAGLAVSGLSGNNSASKAAYPSTTPSATPSSTPSSTPTGSTSPSGGGGVLGDQDQGAGQNVSPEENGGGGNAPGENNGGGGNGVQPSRQVEAGASTNGSSLPFTGFAAIPILFGGLVLLGGGLVLRSRAGHQS
jgi:hypothetical protein